MTQVITYQASGLNTIDLTPRQIEMLEAAGKWPRDATGQEYCSVSHGLHQGRPSMTDAELRADVGLE